MVDLITGNQTTKSEETQSSKTKKWRAHLIEMAQMFILDTTLPGLKYIGQPSRSRPERILWVFMFGLGVGVSVYMCFGMLNKYYTSPAVMSIESADEPLANFPFPSVTICSQNKVSKRKLNDLLKEPRYSKTLNQKDMSLLMRVMIKIDAAFGRNDDLMRINQILIRNQIKIGEVLNLTIKAMVDCNEILLDCRWKGKDKNCSDLFELRPTDDGICCGFNPIESGWNSGSQSSPDPKNVTEILSMAGHSVGLRVVLDSKLEDYVTASRSNGFKVLIHNPTEYPEVGERGFFLSPGFDVHAGLNPMSSYPSDAVKALPINERKCWLSTENNLKFYANYSVSRCLIECLTVEMLNQCNCRPYYYAGNSSGDDVICNLEEYVCLNDAFNAVRGTTDTFDTCSQCYPACESVWYFNELSMGSFPGSLFLDSPLGKRVWNRKNLDKNMTRTEITQYLKKNGAILNIFYKESTGYVYRTDVRFGIEDFISAMGGLLGLGFGCSVISIIELVVHFIFGVVFTSFPSIKHKFQVRPHQNKKHDGHNIPKF